MADLRQAAQQALEALESDNPDIQLRAAIALRAALVEPEQEPWICACGADSYRACKCALKVFPRKPLTDEELDAIYEAHHNQYGECETPGFGYERAIEAAHGIKEQEHE